MWYMNLDALPPGKQMYMAAITSEFDETHDGEYDEYDIVLPSGLGKDAALALIREDPEFIELYGADANIRGLINQSEGYIIFEDQP